MVTLTEIAKESGCSIAAVSRVLSPNPHKGAYVSQEKRELILEVAERFDYRPNRSAEFLKRGKNPIIGVFLPRFANNLIASLMFGISDEANWAGFPVSFSLGMNQKDFYGFLKQRIEATNCGIITYPDFSLGRQAVRLLAEFQERGGQVVVLNNYAGQKSQCDVNIDELHGGALVAKRFIERGCKTFACCLGKAFHKGRIQGFMDTLSEHGYAGLTISGNNEHDFVKIARELVQSGERPLGAFATTDRDAICLIEELKLLDVEVGNEILVAGYDNIDAAEWVKPGLTTVVQPFEELGKIAVQKVCQLVYGKRAPSRLLKPALLLRESS